jgi:hypothetical protein
MNAITRAAYFGPFLEHEDVTPQILARADVWIQAANAGLLAAELDGVKLYKNPFTGTHLSGTGAGGFRPLALLIGARRSPHKRAEAGDLYDPQRELAAWSIMNQRRLKALGIVAMEDPRWTPTWVHWQIVPVASGRFAYVPNEDPPLAAALPGQVIVG